MDISTIVNDKRFQIALGSVVSAGVGFTIGYILGKKNGDVFEISDEAIRDLSDYTRQDHISGDGSNDETVVEDVETYLDDPSQDNVVDKGYVDRGQASETPYQGEIVSPNTSSDGLIQVNVFRKDDDDWDYEAELASRNDVEPYIIHQEEYIADEMGFRQDTCTYYKQDDVMTDSLDTPIYNYRTLMGDLKFGHGSNDPNVVYVRNESQKMEWEILLHTGSYMYEVQGLEFEKNAEDELRHSVYKFRPE